MRSIGIICEYNPLHNGHIYHIKKTKEMFPDSLLILVLNGYFLERGEISVLSKEDKTRLALQNDIDLVVELPVVFGTQSADIFASHAIEILNYLKVSDIVFGSECNNLDLLVKMAKRQLNSDFDTKVKEYLKTGINYPTALSKALDCEEIINAPNDLLGISYVKAILKNNYSITIHTIKRTSNYHDLDSNNLIISASNIRKKLKENKDISSFIPNIVTSCIQTINEDLLWTIFKYKVITCEDLAIYLTVDEGIETRLKKAILEVNNINDFILKVKTKRYTYNKIQRMIVHILLGLTKEINNNLKLEYIHILGFNKTGQKHLKNIRNSIDVSLTPIPTSKIYEFEKRAAFLYEILTNSPASFFELQNKPIIDKEKLVFDKEN